MIEFVSIIVIVFGILQIVLFFKVWGMTNDVNKIATQLGCLKRDYVSDIRKALLKNDKTAAKETIMDCLACDLVDFSEGTNMDKYSSVNDIKKKYQELFEAIGEELPKNIQSIKNRKDILNVFPCSK